MHTPDLGTTAPAARDDLLTSIRLDDALASVRADLPRAESQASSLLGHVSGLFVAGLALLAAGRLHGPAAVWGWTAIELLGGAVLTLTPRPRLNGRFGFPLWVRLTPAQLVDELAAGPAPDSPAEHLVKAHRLIWLSRLLLLKFRSVQAAKVLLLLALTAGVVAAAYTAGR